MSGIDAPQAMLNVARRRLGERADLRLGDAARMPYLDGSFDLVLAATVLHEMLPEVRGTVLDEMPDVYPSGVGAIGPRKCGAYLVSLPKAASRGRWPYFVPHLAAGHVFGPQTVR